MATGSIVGNGLYLEFIPTNDPTSTKVMQVLFTPEGFDEKGVYTEFAMHSRTVADYSPRKQWRVSKCGTSNKSVLTSGVPITGTDAQEMALKMIERFTKAVEKAVYNSAGEAVWELRSKPIAVEITTFDLVEVNEWKTPAPALRRIQKCRVALDFPEKLV